MSLAVYKMKHTKLEYCYKKWLGPEWELDKENGYKNAGTYVVNHQSFNDIFMILGLLPIKPGFVAKDSIKKVLGIGYICDLVLESLFLKRGDKKSQGEVLDQLAERQKQAAEGRNRPLVIFPEAATTNGTGLINFKKGPFFSLQSV